MVDVAGSITDSDIFLMNYLDDSEYLMRTLGTSSVLFIVMIIPEFWRNKESDSLQIEASCLYSLRQIYSARVFLIGVADVFMITLFLLVCCVGMRMQFMDILVQFCSQWSLLLESALPC